LKIICFSIFKYIFCKYFYSYLHLLIFFRKYFHLYLYLHSKKLKYTSLVKTHLFFRYQLHWQSLKTKTNKIRKIKCQYQLNEFIKKHKIEKTVTHYCVLNMCPGKFYNNINKILAFLFVFKFLS